MSINLELLEEISSNSPKSQQISQKEDKEAAESECSSTEHCYQSSQLQENLKIEQKEDQYEKICDIFKFIRNLTNNPSEINYSDVHSHFKGKKKNVNYSEETNTQLKNMTQEQQKKYLNKLSAKRSRDRKKQLIENQERIIEQLQLQINQMKEEIEKKDALIQSLSKNLYYSSNKFLEQEKLIQELSLLLNSQLSDENIHRQQLISDQLWFNKSMPKSEKKNLQDLFFNNFIDISLPTHYKFLLENFQKTSQIMQSEEDFLQLDTQDINSQLVSHLGNSCYLQCLDIDNLLENINSSYKELVQASNNFSSQIEKLENYFLSLKGICTQQQLSALILYYNKFTKENMVIYSNQSSGSDSQKSQYQFQDDIIQM